MSVHYSIQPAENRIHTTCAGFVTVEEVREHFAALAADPAFRPALDVLLDLTPCTSLPTPDDLRGVVATIQALGPQRPFGACAIVADRDALFGMSRIFEVYAQHAFTALRVFRSTTDAVNWLAARTVTRASVE